MARSSRKQPRMGLAEGYESATAADIARYGVRKRGESAEPERDDVIQGHVVEEDGLIEPVGASSSSPAPEGRMRAAHHPAGDVPASPAGELELAPTNSNGQDAYSALAASATEAAEGREGARAALSRNRAAGRDIPLADSDARFAEERRALRRKVVVSGVVLAVVFFFSLCVYGATTSASAGMYVVYSPAAVAQVAFDHVYNFLGGLTHLWSPKPWGYDIQPALHYLSADVGDGPVYNGEVQGGWDLYNGIVERAQVLVITLIAAVLLSVSGMLYQNVFKNPIAGPGMLGVSSGVTLGMMLLVAAYGAGAQTVTAERYLWCYGLGAAVLLFVILAGRKLSGKGKPFDIVTMLLLGSVVGQLVGIVVSYYTLYIMDSEMYEVYVNVSQMLTVDTSNIAWMCLIAVSVVSLAPVVFLRFRMNALAYDEQEVRMMGVNFTALRAVALICGALMILAAQVHIGAVAMVSLIVPFLSRSWFGCEFRKQLVGNVCISTILLLVCRDIVDLIPFVGQGLGIGSAVSVMALPLFLLIMSRHMRGWE